MLSLDDIVPLRLADVSFPEWHPRAGQAGPVYGFLVRHPRGAILVDTGIGPPHTAIDAAYRPERRDLREAIGSASITVDEIRLVVNTHLHFDHCGWNHILPGVRIIVQATELTAARAPGYTIKEWVDFRGAAYDPVAGEAEIAEGVRVVPTPGHTQGHQSVIIETSAGRLAIAGQAAETASEFAALDDESVGRLHAMDPVRVLFSHDDETWQP